MQAQNEKKDYGKSNNFFSLTHNVLSPSCILVILASRKRAPTLSPMYKDIIENIGLNWQSSLGVNFKVDSHPPKEADFMAFRHGVLRTDSFR